MEKFPYRLTIRDSERLPHMSTVSIEKWGRAAIEFEADSD
jgi:hypothetical protein